MQEISQQNARDGFIELHQRKIRCALPRLLQWVVVIAVGTTVTFTIPRLLPTDPVEQTLRRVSTSMLDPRAIETFKATLTDLYGLQGTPLEQYGRFWARLLRADLGPSLGAFPTPVTQIIRDGLPWTIGLLGSAPAPWRPASLPVTR